MHKKSVWLIFLLLAVALFPVVTAGAQDGPQTNITGARPGRQQLTVIIYTLSTCPHCQAAKEFFTSSKIPFISREVDTDSQHLDELMALYDKMAVPNEKRGVPLILIGDSIKLQGFNREKVQEALKKVLSE